MSNAPVSVCKRASFASHHVSHPPRSRGLPNRLFFAHRTLDLLLIVLLLVLTLELKARPGLEPRHAWYIGCMILLITVDVATVLVNLAFFAINQQKTSELHLSRWMVVKLTAEFARMHDFFPLMLAHALTVIACVILVVADLPAFHDGGNATVVGRALKSKGGTGTNIIADELATEQPADEGLWFALWILLAAALFLRMWNFLESASRAVEALHILVLAVRKVFWQDILTFMVLFVWQLATAFATLFTLYPRSGERTFSLFPFNTQLEAAKALFEFALMGENLDMDDSLLSGAGSVAMWSEMATLQLVAVVLFCVAYTFFALLFVILLLNLLIAMLTHTFDNLLQESTLQSRLQFARSLLRLELIATAFGMRTKVGEPIEGQSDRYVYVFRALVKRDDEAEDNEAPSLAVRMGENFMDSGAATDPFKEPTPSQLTRLEMLLHEVKESGVAAQQSEWEESTVPKSTLKKNTSMPKALVRLGNKQSARFGDEGAHNASNRALAIPSSLMHSVPTW